MVVPPAEVNVCAPESWVVSMVGPAVVTLLTKFWREQEPAPVPPTQLVSQEVPKLKAFADCAPRVLRAERITVVVTVAIKVLTFMAE